ILEGVDLARGSFILDIGVLPLIIGTAAAFISGLLSINVFMKLIKNHSMLGFAVYTLLLGIVVTLLPIWGVL
ncbi:MAG: hypothetical protein K2N18_04785, partial [Clostridia bacterium]|nr:hypothetical protein [Clostridia bacterium]